jgi:hypothetical protein
VLRLGWVQHHLPDRGRHDGPTLDPANTYEVVYEVRGREDGAQINILTVQGDQSSVDSEETITTSSTSQKLTAVATSVDLRSEHWEAVRLHSAAPEASSPGRTRPELAVSRLSAAIPHAASHSITAPCIAASLSWADVVRGRAAEGCVKWCGWHGMQGSEGSTI